MPDSESLLLEHPSTPDPAPSAPALDRCRDTAPRIVTVLCPAGFTPYAAAGLSLDQPLFARVTYRPA